MAQLGAAGEQEAGVAAGLGRGYPEEALVDFGIGDLWVDALEIHAHATAIEGGGGGQRVERPGEGIGDGEGMEGRKVVAGSHGVVGDKAAGGE